MSLVPAEILLAAAAVFTVVKIAAEQQQMKRKPIRVRVEEQPKNGDCVESE
jgi:hypothetical protein